MSFASDYERWGRVHAHANGEGFRRALQAGGADGVHQLHLTDELTLDVLVQGAPREDDTISVPVFFNGRVPGRPEKTGPFFSGGRVGAAVSPVYVAVSDPTVDRDPEVSLAWYTGFAGADVTAAILEALRALSDAWQRELVFVGGSGGGFASLRYAALLDRPASALVWNPQTDILRYSRGFVDVYLESAFEDTSFDGSTSGDWSADRAELCARAGIDRSVTDAQAHDPARIRRLLYLQNLDDWHLTSHAMPYVQAHGFQDIGTGSLILGPDHVVQAGMWGAGHSAPPHDLLISALGEFLRDDAPSLEVARRTVLDETCDPAALVRSPKDLRTLAPTIITHARARHDPKLPQVTVELPDGAPAPGYGGLRFGLTQVLNGKHSQLAWFTSTGELKYASDDRWADSELLIAVRDGLNHHLGQIPVEGVAVSSVDDPLQADRAFIYGSCVTRDAFQLDGIPSLSDYFARSPLISAFGRAPAELPTGMDLETVPSAFQRRMVTRDLQKSLPGALQALSSRDVIIIDLIDERIPVAWVNGGVLACSSEASRAGFTANKASQLAVGRPGFITAWQRAAEELIEMLQNRRVVLNKAYWAVKDDTGQELQSRFPVELHNKTLRHMYTVLERGLQCDVIDYPDNLFVADSKHRWGLSPFHYTAPFYSHFVARLQEILR